MPGADRLWRDCWQVHSIYCNTEQKNGNPCQKPVRGAHVKGDDVGALGVRPCHFDGILHNFRPAVGKDMAVKALGNDPAQPVQ